MFSTRQSGRANFSQQNEKSFLSIVHGLIFSPGRAPGERREKLIHQSRPLSFTSPQSNSDAQPATSPCELLLSHTTDLSQH